PRRGLLDLVPQNGRLLEVLFFDSFGKLLLQVCEPVRKITALAQRCGHFAHMARTFVHRLEQALQRFGKSLVAYRAAQPAGLLEIRLSKATGGALQAGSATSLFDFLRDR